MSIDQPDVIDVIGSDPATGAAILCISDHLDWDDEAGHLQLLQDKINAYLRFIEGGELDELYPTATERTATIQVVGQYEQPEIAQAFMREAGKIVSQAGYDLRFRQLDN
jgi:hypothetical protein